MKMKNKFICCCFFVNLHFSEIKLKRSNAITNCNYAPREPSWCACSKPS